MIFILRRKRLTIKDNLIYPSSPKIHTMGDLTIGLKKDFNKDFIFVAPSWFCFLVFDKSAYYSTKSCDLVLLEDFGIKA